MIGACGGARNPDTKRTQADVSDREITPAGIHGYTNEATAQRLHSHEAAESYQRSQADVPRPEITIFTCTSRRPNEPTEPIRCHRRTYGLASARGANDDAMPNEPIALNIRSSWHRVGAACRAERDKVIPTTSRPRRRVRSHDGACISRPAKRTTAVSRCHHRSAGART
jgi:hypothetical protein